jgi:AhpC/TSA antioxidant enzyme
MSKTGSETMKGMSSNDNDNDNTTTTSSSAAKDTIMDKMSVQRRPSSGSMKDSSCSNSYSTSRSAKSSSKKSLSGADEEVVKKTRLIPVDCSFGTVTENKCDIVICDDMIRKERRRLTSKRDSGVMLLFAIRRPGCASCRLNGRTLSEVTKQQNVGCVGIIKETSVDDDALIDLYRTYFHHPIYKDDKWRIFEAMGNRKISAWKLAALVPKLTMKYKKENVKNIMTGGDLFTQGGILVFDKDGNLRYTYYERYGEFFDSEHLIRVIEEAKLPLPSILDSSIAESDFSNEAQIRAV